MLCLFNCYRELFPTFGTASNTSHLSNIYFSILDLIVELFSYGFCFSELWQFLFFFVLFFLYLATSIMFNVYWANFSGQTFPQLDHPVTEFCKRKWFSKSGF